ncbi:hypothetical protein GCM10009733_081640 [Nonomuraea maheshkhaliensis]|uniref:Uncharacterized protein n=1 Tax=Nonomuraea maheshkhaliensis TaxID=419590 RepID=A0ABP4SN12_9ACTN
MTKANGFSAAGTTDLTPDLSDKASDIEDARGNLPMPYAHMNRRVDQAKRKVGSHAR